MEEVAAVDGRVEYSYGGLAGAVPVEEFHADVSGCGGDPSAAFGCEPAGMVQIVDADGIDVLFITVEDDPAVVCARHTREGRARVNDSRAP